MTASVRPKAGDFASRVARILAVKYDSVYCVHFNMINIQSPPTEYPISSLTDLEEMGLGRAMQFVESGQGYRCVCRPVLQRCTAEIYSPSARSTRLDPPQLVLSLLPLLSLSLLG